MSANQHPLAESKIYLCKYKVENLVFMLGETAVSMDHSNILSIEYLAYYDFNIRSILKVSLRLDIRQKLWLLHNKRDIVAKFELVKFGMDTDVENIITTSEYVFNQEFKIYFNDQEESIDTSSMEQRMDVNEGNGFASTDINSESYFDSQNILDVYLFDQELLNASNNIFNTVITYDTLQNTVARLLTDTKHTKVLMSPFENDEIYQELLVPPNPAWKSLIYLDQYYGFYEAGAMIFYDVDTCYILNSNGQLTAKREGEWVETVIYVTTLNLSTPGNGMFRMDDQPIFYCSVNEMDVNIHGFSESNNEKIGSEAKIVTTDDITINTVSSNQPVTDQKNQRIINTKKDDNKYLHNIYKVRSAENECPVYISAQNLDITAFTPNKLYHIVFDEPSKEENYGGDKYYRLAYSYHCLKAESGEYMSSSHRIALKRRMEKDE